ncbi:transporter substrate-binding domain-containing protein [Deinococcus hopiensis]|uniref:transporter substrate-binding domain-containing protein n=1 Tax=Deinococcus hopiensis TaxID=309885 RepID=UPI0014821EBE|nr:transporter substrate-binding domain-containing protein [Deinococcus hopiensis]
MKKLPFRKQLQVYRIFGDAIKAVAPGEVDAVLVDRLTFLRATKTYSKAGLTLGAPGAATAVQQGGRALRPARNPALANVLKDGLYTQASMKFFGPDLRCGGRKPTSSGGAGARERPFV